MLGPVIRGEKISLEPAREEFLPEFIRWFADLDITRYLLVRSPLSLKQEQEWFENVCRDATTVHWTIILGQKPIGVTGIHNIDWINRQAGTGMIIGVQAAWGQGYATEAVALRTGFAFQELGLERLETHSFAENGGMHKALERAGHRRIGVRTHAMYRSGAWHDTILFELLRDEWQAKQKETS